MGNIYSVNTLYLIIGKVDGHIKENSGSKYLVFYSTELHSTDEKQRIIKKSKQNFRMGLKMKLKR